VGRWKFGQRADYAVASKQKRGEFAGRDGEPKLDVVDRVPERVDTDHVPRRGAERPAAAALRDECVCLNQERLGMEQLGDISGGTMTHDCASHRFIDNFRCFCQRGLFLLQIGSLS